MASISARTLKAANWIGLFALILLAWGALFATALPEDLREISKFYGSEFWETLCAATPHTAGYSQMAMMWALMSFGMMAPTSLPAFATYIDIGHTTRTGFWRLLAGYASVWFGFSLIAAGLQLLLFRSGSVSAFGDSQSTILSTALLLTAGLYQFSPLKEACLAKCRMPLTFFMQHWDEGPAHNGIRLGIVCLGCCWALMLLGFVGGVMNLAFMGLATLLMVIEKLPDIGRWLTRPLGVGLILSAVWVMMA